MLEYQILEYKPTIINHGVKYIDLLSKTYDDGERLIRGVPIVVNKYYVARPDLISFAMYGDDKYADILCKVNGLSNPFELNENMIIYAPDLEFCMEAIVKERAKSDVIEASSIANTNTSVALFRSGETSVESREQNDEIYHRDKNNRRKKISDKRTANEQTLKDRNYVIDRSNGVVFY